jgi:hypothetical protein
MRSRLTGGISFSRGRERWLSADPARVYDGRSAERLCEGNDRASSSSEEDDSRLEDRAGLVESSVVLAAESRVSDAVEHVAAADRDFDAGALQNVSRFMSRQLIFS